jgi:hypothetical protein
LLERLSLDPYQMPNRLFALCSQQFRKMKNGIVLIVKLTLIG